MNKNYWTKIDGGWYEGKRGEVIQCWYSYFAAPKGKPGWYIWPNKDTNEMLGPFKTMKEAIKEIKIENL